MAPSSAFLTVDQKFDKTFLNRYITKRASGVEVLHPQKLDFLKDLPGLRSVSVFRQVPDDSAVYDCIDLESLVLLDRSFSQLQADRLPRLQRLQLDFRPGLESLRDHPALQDLAVYGFEGSDVAWMGRPKQLKEIMLQGVGQVFDLTTLETVAKNLKSLQLQEMVASHHGLPRLPDLEEFVVHLSGSELDLTNLRQILPKVTHVQIGGRSCVRSVGPLRTLPLAYLGVGAGSALDEPDAGGWSKVAP